MINIKIGEREKGEDDGRPDCCYNLISLTRTDSELVAVVSQKLDARSNRLQGLPTELSGLVNLEELLLSSNHFSEPPVSVLRHLTALEIIDLHGNLRQEGTEEEVLRVPSSLLPILHPGLVKLDLRQWRPICVPMTLDAISMFHLEWAVAEVACRIPVPKVVFYKGPSVLQIAKGA